MDALHMHLVLVHIPIVGPIFILGILIAAAWKDSKELLITGLVLGIFVGLAGGATYLAGESAEDISETMPGTIESLIEEHEEMAQWAVVALGIVGAASVAAMIPALGGVARRPVALVLVALNLMALPAIGLTANAGGKIRHANLREAPGVMPADGPAHGRDGYEESEPGPHPGEDAHGEQYEADEYDDRAEDDDEGSEYDS